MWWQGPPSVINCSDFGGTPEMWQPLHLIADPFLTCSARAHRLADWSTHTHTHTYIFVWDIHV